MTQFRSGKLVPIFPSNCCNLEGFNDFIERMGLSDIVVILVSVLTPAKCSNGTSGGMPVGLSLADLGCMLLHSSMPHLPLQPPC
jgi:hypothetical protein